MKTGIKIVVIGGGSGISVVLRGIKKVTEEVTAIVTMADNGGSSGKLRKDFGMLPPGDIRNCILSLSETESFMHDLMQHRFKDGVFKGHSLGNILLAGLVDMTGGFENALIHMHDIFAVVGKVIPVTLEDVHILAELASGEIIYGESEIAETVKKTSDRIARVKMVPDTISTTPIVCKSIKEADIIMLGPGSLYTSVIPNLLVGGVVEAINDSNAKVVYCANLFTQAGETIGYSVSDHLEAIEKHAGDIIDAVIVNNGTVEENLYQKYREKHADIVLLTDEERLEIISAGINVFENDYIDIREGYVRHNADMVAKELINIAGTRIFKKGKRQY